MVAAQGAAEMGTRGERALGKVRQAKLTNFRQELFPFIISSHTVRTCGPVHKSVNDSELWQFILLHVTTMRFVIEG